MINNRPRSLKSSLGSLMVFIVFLVLSIEYYCFAIMTWWPRIGTDLAIYAYIILIAFHFLAVMLLWSFIMTLIMDPGEVPIYWGFRVGDPENRRRRYCLMCNLYKPERCHHCSACGRWVLNMDHHCPWVNNCIGFKNRKYFMLLLFYVQITTLFILICWSMDVVRSAKVIYADISDSKFHYVELRKAIIIIIWYIFVGLVWIMMYYFFSFHRRLVRENKTTIENIEHDCNPTYESRYNINLWHNIYQVMGTDKWVWWIPINPFSNSPEGDGIYFEKNCETSSEGSSEEEEEDDRPRNYQNPTQSGEDRDIQGNEPDMIERLTNIHATNGEQIQNADPQTNGVSNAPRNGTYNGSTHGQGDKMTLHIHSEARKDNLNNIVQSVSTGNINNVRKRNENARREEYKGEYSKVENTISSQREETKEKQYYERPTHGDSSRGNPSLVKRESRGQNSSSKIQQKKAGNRNTGTRDRVPSKPGRGTKTRTTGTSKGGMRPAFK